MSRPKVFCIGFQKTGTSSMRDALEMLGCSVTGVFGHGIPLDTLRRTYVHMGLDLASEHDAVEDMPWPLMFRELDTAFPGSKFVLTVRDADRWYASIASHFGKNTNALQQMIYGEQTGAPVGNEARFREVYAAHNSDVRAYFAGRANDLLIMDLERGDGWDKLCPFLGEPIRDTPFVRTNAAGQRRSFVNRVRKRLARLGLPIAVMDR